MKIKEKAMNNQQTEDNELLYDLLRKDIRFKEGLKACINCGTCTAICPAAQFYDYDPRKIVALVQKRNEKQIEELLKSDTIWYCGECLSCKSRCPRSNTAGYIIQSLRKLSIDKGYFIESEKGRQQLAIKRTIGEHMLKHGYCVYIDEVSIDKYPEQGPVWQWLKDNKDIILDRLNAEYKKLNPGTLRQIPDDSLDELKNIFRESGALDMFDTIEHFSSLKAKEMNLEIGNDDNSEYFNHVYTQNQSTNQP